jgi:hypothetical protein
MPSQAMQDSIDALRDRRKASASQAPPTLESWRAHPDQAVPLHELAAFLAGGPLADEHVEQRNLTWPGHCRWLSTRRQASRVPRCAGPWTAPTCRIAARASAAV